KNPRSKSVTYVGLESHPQYALAKKQMKGFTGMLAIEVDGADDAQQYQRAQAILSGLKYFHNAVSLGGVESLTTHPASMWGADQSGKHGNPPSFSKGLLCISVGIEHIADLLADFETALANL